MPEQHPRSLRPSKYQAAAANNAPCAPARHRAADVAIPIWQRVAESILNDIKSGRYIEGMRLPPETMLAREYGVNRHTLRRAIADLAARAKLRNIPHSGTIVERARIPFPLDKTTRFGAAMEGAGHKLSGTLISSETKDPPEWIANQLKVAARTSVIEMVHVRKANERPFVLATTWLPADRFARLPTYYEALGSLTAAFSQYGVSHLERTHIRISSRWADAFERQQLELDDGSILLVIDTVNVDLSGEPLHVSTFYFSADRFEFVSEP